MKRLCFLSPDLEHARRVVADLKANGVAERHIYAVARYGADLDDLPDAGPESDDFIHAYRRGVELGGSAGLLVGLAALAFPPSGIVVGGGLVLLVGLWGAGLGGLLTGIAGAAFPSSRLEAFAASIQQGQILVMADVPASEVHHYEALIKAHDPAVTVEGIEPPAPLIPR
jgi:hypothetical protein